MALSYDVIFYKIRKRADRPRRPFELRWKVGGVPKSRSFATRALADNHRAKLMAAARAGEEFDTETGEPVSWAESNGPTWYAHARSYMKMKWPHIAARNRVSLADSLATFTPALVKTDDGAPDARIVRTALFKWAFNPTKWEDEPPHEIAAALAWIEANSIAVKDLKEAAMVRKALDALSLKLDGAAAASATISRKRAVFYNALGYAVEIDLLPANPLDKIQWTAPEVAEEVDRRVVANPSQVQQLLAAVKVYKERGAHLVAFFACMYYAAMRPSEVAHLNLDDCHLPDEGWGRLDLAGSAPYAGTEWTDDGEANDVRQLKRRARNAIRPVPIPPVLVRLLKAHLAAFGTAPDGRLFRAALGGYIPNAEYGKAWDAARKRALTPRQYNSPLGGRPYDLRHGGVSLWLNSGVAPTVVARRAGHSVAVLLKVYAGCLDGEDEIANMRIESTLESYGDSAAL